MTVALPDKADLLKMVQSGRDKWDANFRPPGVEIAGVGEQSVWDYPRPPVVVSPPNALRIMCGATVIAEAKASDILDVRETAGAPVPYFNPDQVRTWWLMANGGVSVCEWKGAALAYDLVLPDGERVLDAAWCYPDPFDDLDEGYSAIAGRFAFYPAKLACFEQSGAGTGDDAWERVRPQPGNLYGGWVSRRIKGPIKGMPGTQHW